MLFSSKRFSALVALAVTVGSTTAFAGDWSEIKVSARAGSLPDCVTPGRLMALAKARNSDISPRFETIALDYMRQGEAMSLRWDIAFMQMLVETNDLSFKKGVRGGAVKPEQNNFGGIGSMGGGEAGESFKSVADGVRAHLEHIKVYTGVAVENALSERTRKFSNWDAFKRIQEDLGGRPATFGDVISHWAPKSKAYISALEALSDAFDEQFCKRPDPRPEWVADRGVKVAPSQQIASASVEAPAAAVVATPKGVELARNAIDTNKSDAPAVRTNLGAGLGASLARAKAQAPSLKMLNETPAAQPEAQKTAAASAAVVAPPAKPVDANASKSAMKCRVWTASYGTDKALIIKAVVDGVINFTVLDVNAGQETREADAYIGAYAKGGRVEAQFATQAEALDKAFDLCPEG